MSVEFPCLQKYIYQGSRINDHCTPFFWKINVHCIPAPDKCCCTSSCCIVFSKACATALNVLPLSEIIFKGSPRLAVKCLKLLMNDEVVKFGTTSRGTACTTQQVYRQTQTFPPAVIPVALMYKGPEKSTPV